MALQKPVPVGIKAPVPVGAHLPTGEIRQAIPVGVHFPAGERERGEVRQALPPGVHMPDGRHFRANQVDTCDSVAVNASLSTTGGRSGRNRRGGGRNKNKVAGTKENPTWSMEGEAIKAMIACGDVPAALNCFLNDASSCIGAFSELIEKLLRMGEVMAVYNMIVAVKQAGRPITMGQMLHALLNMPQGVNPEPCAQLVNALANIVQWQAEDLGAYFVIRARQVVLEFTEEAMKAVQSMIGKGVDVLVRQGKCTPHVTLQKGMKDDEIVCIGGEGGGNEETRGIQAGDCVALSRMDMSIAECFLCECEVICVKPLVLKPVDTSHAILQDVFNPNCLWRVDKLGNRMSYARMMAAIHLLCEGVRRPDDYTPKKARGRLREADRPTNPIFKSIAGSHGNIAAEAAKPPLVLMSKTNILMKQQWGNQSQQEAIAASLGASLSLIQGPPGTGKTATALRLLQEWISSSGDILTSKKTALLATSDSNIAVDNVVEGLARIGVRVVRLGRPEMSRPELLQYCADEIAAKVCGVSKLSELRDREKRKAQEEVRRCIEEAQVVCCTAIGAGSAILNEYTFPKVLMDESSQATEPATIVPICKGCKQLVLIGDHCQLPPTVSSDLATKEGMNLSLFERLVWAGVQTSLLQVQYRMHPTISAFPRIHFYSGQIIDGLSPEERMAPYGFAWPDQNRPVAVVPVPGQETPEGTSWENEAEAHRVVRIVKDIVLSGIDTSEVGVVTPYGAQARLLRRLLARANIRTGRDFGGVEVNSVDSFQGREKDVVVMSTVRASAAGGIGFTADWRRVNVAFTRARRGFIVVCEPHTLSREDRTWAPWLRWIQEEGLYDMSYQMPNLPPPNPNALPVGLASMAIQRPSECDQTEEVLEMFQSDQTLAEEVKVVMEMLKSDPTLAEQPEVMEMLQTVQSDPTLAGQAEVNEMLQSVWQYQQSAQVPMMPTMQSGAEVVRLPEPKPAGVHIERAPERIPAEQTEAKEALQSISQEAGQPTPAEQAEAAATAVEAASAVTAPAKAAPAAAEAAADTVPAAAAEAAPAVAAAAAEANATPAAAEAAPVAEAKATPAAAEAAPAAAAAEAGEAPVAAAAAEATPAASEAAQVAAAAEAEATPPTAAVAEAAEAAPAVAEAASTSAKATALPAAPPAPEAAEAGAAATGTTPPAAAEAEATPAAAAAASQAPATAPAAAPEAAPEAAAVQAPAPAAVPAAAPEAAGAAVPAAEATQQATRVMQFKKAALKAAQAAKAKVQKAAQATMKYGNIMVVQRAPSPSRGAHGRSVTPPGGRPVAPQKKRQRSPVAEGKARGKGSKSKKPVDDKRPKEKEKNQDRKQDGERGKKAAEEKRRRSRSKSRAGQRNRSTSRQRRTDNQRDKRRQTGPRDPKDNRNRSRSKDKRNVREKRNRSRSRDQRDNRNRSRSRDQRNVRRRSRSKSKDNRNRSPKNNRNRSPKDNRNRSPKDNRNRSPKDNRTRSPKDNRNRSKKDSDNTSKGSLRAWSRSKSRSKNPKDRRQPEKVILQPKQQNKKENGSGDEESSEDPDDIDLRF